MLPLRLRKLLRMQNPALPQKKLLRKASPLRASPRQMLPLRLTKLLRKASPRVIPRQMLPLRLKKLLRRAIPKANPKVTPQKKPSPQTTLLPPTPKASPQKVNPRTASLPKANPTASPQAILQVPQPRHRTSFSQTAPKNSTKT